MEKQKYVSNRQGECPVCGSCELTYKDSGYLEDYISFEYECKKCGTEGAEWYKLVFDGHEVYRKTEDDYDYEDVDKYIIPENNL